MNGDTSEIKEYPLDEITRLQENHPHQDTNRKSVPKEAQSEENAENIREKTADYEEPDRSEKTGFSALLPDTADENQTIKTKENNRNKNKKAVLGKPVRRENPNRRNIPSDISEGETQKGNQKQEETGASSHVSKTNWADALEKAIQAIEQDK